MVRLIRWTSTLDKSNAHRCWRKSKLVVPVPTHEVHGRQIQRLRIKQVVLGVLKFQSSGFQSLHFVLQCYGVGVEGLRFLFGFLGGAGCLLAVWNDKVSNDGQCYSVCSTKRKERKGKGKQTIENEIKRGWVFVLLVVLLLCHCCRRTFCFWPRCSRPTLATTFVSWKYVSMLEWCKVRSRSFLPHPWRSSTSKSFATGCCHGRLKCNWVQLRKIEKG